MCRIVRFWCSKFWFIFGCTYILGMDLVGLVFFLEQEYKFMMKLILHREFEHQQRYRAGTVSSTEDI